MLQITVPQGEFFDEVNQRFVYTKEQTLQLEHSLLSLSKWESKWKKPFSDPKTQKTLEEQLDYVRCMTLTKNVDPHVYMSLTRNQIKQINEYIDDPMTATTFSEDKRKPKRPNKQIITAEILYYDMIAYNIPFECEKWHLNRLITLIRVCNIKNNPPKPRSKKELRNSYAALNAARRKRHNTKG